MATAANSASKASETRAGLLRDLGAAHAASIVIGVVIGSGIFLVPTEMIKAAGSAWLVYLAWIVGGVFSFFGAATYAELGAMKPQAGGEYVYIRDAFGSLAGFLTGWTWTIIVKPTSLAAISIGIVQILSNFPALSFLAHQVMAFANFGITIGQLVAMAFVVFVSLVNYVGVRRAGNFQLALTILKIALIVVISALAFTSHGQWSHFARHYSGATGGIAGFVAALAAALWAYDGWSDLNMVAEEVRDPERSIPLALVGGLLVIAVLYMLVNAAVQYALAPAAVAGSMSPMSDAVRASFLGGAAAIVVSAAMVVSLSTTLNGVAMSGSRMAFALSRDGNFFSSLAKVHPRFHTPHIAILVQAILSLCFLVIGGNFRQLFTLALFAEWLSYMAASGSLFVFKRQMPSSERKFSLWSYPVAPAVFILASAALLYYTFASNVLYSTFGSLVILAGIPVYYAFVQFRKSSLTRTI